MGSIAKRPDCRWRARYRMPPARSTRHFLRKVDAQRWLDEVTAAIVTGQYVDPKAGRVKLKDYAADWQRAQVSSEGTARIVDNAPRLHILPKLGERPVQSIRPSEVQALVKGMTMTHAPGAVRNVYDVLTRVFAATVDDRVIAESPCRPSRAGGRRRSITLPADHSSEVQPPTVEHVVALRDAMPERYRAAVVMLAGSGLRIGKLLGLEVADVDFLRRTVRVERQRMQDGRLAPPKTGSSKPTVPLGRVVVDEMAAHLAPQPSTGALFLDERGEPLGYRRWKSLWRAARRAAEGVSDDVDTHDLGHFFASALIAGGASAKQVQQVLGGHSDPTITLWVYSHLWPGDDDHTRSVMDSTLGILRTGCGPASSPADVSAGQEA